LRSAAGAVASTSDARLFGVLLAVLVTTLGGLTLAIRRARV
jgi:hypothetical protein